MKKFIATAVLAVAMTGCTDADVVSRNLSKSADMFELDRRIVFYNTWKGEYLLSIEGRCSIENDRQRVAVTCKTLPGEYKKHYLGLGGHVTYFSEQLESASTSAYRYRVVFKPAAIIPDVEVRD